MIIGHLPVIVTVPVPFRNTGSSARNAPVGEMRIRIGDGSEIHLQAGTGDDVAKRVALTIGEATRTFDAVRGDGYANLTFETAP